MLPTNSRIVSVLLGVVLMTATAWGGDFRVDNKVFNGNAAEPESHGTTIFAGGQVYDFLDQPAEVVVLDPVHERFLLLDSTRRVTAEVTTKEVVAFNDWQKHWAMEQPSPVLNFFGNPLVSRVVRPQRVGVDAEQRVGDVQGQVDGGRQGRRRAISPVFGLVRPAECGLEPEARPPFARMMVNAAIARQGAIPAEIQMTATVKARQGSSRRRFAVSIGWFRS